MNALIVLTVIGVLAVPVTWASDRWELAWLDAVLGGSLSWHPGAKRGVR